MIFPPVDLLELPSDIDKLRET